MTHNEALAIVISLAANWGENAEEGFSRRIAPEDDDIACVQIAEKSRSEVEEVIQVRDLWRACKILQTMSVEHVLTIRCQCPVNANVDEYQTTVVADRLIKVEDILAAGDGFAKLTMFQEELTQMLATKLAARVTTVGWHSGVKTTCVSGLSASV